MTVPDIALKQEMLRRLKRTHRRNLPKLARKQEMLKNSRRHAAGLLRTSPEASLKAGHKTQEDTLAKSSQARLNKSFHIPASGLACEDSASVSCLVFPIFPWLTVPKSDSLSQKSNSLSCLNFVKFSQQT